MFEIYVSAQNDDSGFLSKSENLARVINAIASPDSDIVYPAFRDVILAEGYWRGNAEHTVILATENESHHYVRRAAESLRRRLNQECVMVVSNIPIDDDEWDPVYRNNRINTRTVDAYTLREGIGQQPYAYMAIAHSDRKPTHWIHFVSRY